MSLRTASATEERPTTTPVPPETLLGMGGTDEGEYWAFRKAYEYHRTRIEQTWALSFRVSVGHLYSSKRPRTIDGDRRLLLPLQDGAEWNSNSDFVPLSKPVLRVPTAASPFEGSTYRSIAADPAPPVDSSDGESEADVGPDLPTFEQARRGRILSAERHLRDIPDDISAWIQYADMVAGLESGAATLREQSAKEAGAAKEIVLAILARALESHPNNMFSSILHIAHLEAAGTVWPTDKVTQRWANVLRELRGRLSLEDTAQLWLRYISWSEGRGFSARAGGVEEVLDVFGHGLRALQDLARTNEVPSVIEEYQLYFFLRACLFLRHAGYEERAIAMFQALIEITFFKPDRLRPPPQPQETWFAGLMSEFANFWSTEQPRIGEEGATGWRNSWRAGPTLVVGTESQRPPADPADQPISAWLEAERFAESQGRISKRSRDVQHGDEADEDPFAVVLFPDIEPFLFAIRDPEVRYQLVFAFLNYMGLSITPSDASTNSPSVQDPALFWTALYNSAFRRSMWPPQKDRPRLPWANIDGDFRHADRVGSLDQPFLCPVKCWASSGDQLFARNGKWFLNLENVDLEAVDVTFLRNALGLLRSVISDTVLDVFAFALESVAPDPKAAVRLAKTIIAARQGDLQLWDGYARLERSRGNISIARTVYVTAIRAARIAAVNTAVHDVESSEDELWAGWADMEFEEGEQSRCLNVLLLWISREELALDDLSADTPSRPLPSLAMLKAKQRFAALGFPMRHEGFSLALLFAYISDGLEAAQNVSLRQLASLTPSTGDHERALQYVSKLLVAHRSRQPMPTGIMRKAMEEAIDAYPNNTIFLSIYLWSETGGKVFGRAQRLIDRIVGGSNIGVAALVWAVWAEARLAHRTFWEKDGGGAERVRALLRRSIETHTGQQSAALWKIFIDFETQFGRLDAAKKLCYRAVAARGACKELYLLPFESPLNSHFTRRELRDWADTMVARGLRIRIPMEEYMPDDEASDVGSALPDDEALMEDELAFLRERQALKPY